RQPRYLRNASRCVTITPVWYHQQCCGLSAVTTLTPSCIPTRRSRIMDVSIVSQAIAVLQQQGKSASVRNVHRLIGGSFRDISRLLQELRAVLPDDQPPQEQAKPVPAVPPRSAAAVQVPVEGVTSESVTSPTVAL